MEQEAGRAQLLITSCAIWLSRWLCLVSNFSNLAPLSFLLLLAPNHIFIFVSWPFPTAVKTCHPEAVESLTFSSKFITGGVRESTGAHLFSAGSVWLSVISFIQDILNNFLYFKRVYLELRVCAWSTIALNINKTYIPTIPSLHLHALCSPATDRML